MTMEVDGAVVDAMLFWCCGLWAPVPFQKFEGDPFFSCPVAGHWVSASSSFVRNRIFVFLRLAWDCNWSQNGWWKTWWSCWYWRSFWARMVNPVICSCYCFSFCFGSNCVCFGDAILCYWLSQCCNPPHRRRRRHHRIRTVMSIEMTLFCSGLVSSIFLCGKKENSDTVVPEWFKFSLICIVDGSWCWMELPIRLPLPNCRVWNRTGNQNGVVGRPCPCCLGEHYGNLFSRGLHVLRFANWPK